MNAKMPELRRAFEAAGFADVKTVIASGNVVFTTRASSAASLERKCEAAMTKALGRTFLTIVRRVDDLRELLEADPFRVFPLDAKAKRIVTFLREPPAKTPALPIELDGASILAVRGADVLSAYLPSPKGPVFMTLLEKTFGKEATTRTWDTVKKVAK
jgi:uncharacterized protein (DUF1697 family)